MTKGVIKDMQKYVTSVDIENILIRVSPHTPKTEKETKDNLIEELADVLLNIQQMMYLFSDEEVEESIESIQSYKTNRWWRRTFISQEEN